MITVLLEGLDFPESPIWSEQDGCLYFVEWLGNRLCAWREGPGQTVLEFDAPGGPSGLAQDDEGNFWVCLYDAPALAKFNKNGKKLAWIDHWGRHPFKGVCDLAMDTHGGVYFSDSGDFEEDWITGRPAGAIYYLAQNGTLIQVDQDIRFPNGLTLSPQGDFLYVNEHRANRVLRYKVGEDGTLFEQQVFFEMDDECLLEPSQSFELGPDGCCVDEAGNLYLAHYGGGKLVKVKPDGTKANQIRLPRGRKPSNCTFQPQQNAFYVTETELGMLYRVEVER